MPNILIINTVDFGMNGISSVIMNYYSHIVDERFHFDFIVSNYIDDKYAELIRKRGDKFYVLKKRKRNPLRYINNLKKIIKTNKYDIVHINGNSSIMMMELVAVRLSKVNCVRFVHVHNTHTDYPVFNLLLYPFFINSYDYALAASEAAGRFLYREKKFKIINNGIDVQRYTFNMHKRVSMREKLNITDKFVLLHIGRFNDQKNHSFLIDVFSEVIKRNPNSILILIGVGPRSDQVKRKVLEENLNNNVLFLGEKHHVEDFLSAADVFVFPSKFEALGIVNIEAQCSGLKCVVSDQVPSQAKVTNNLVFLPIRYPDRWAKNILKFKNGYNRQGQMNEIIKSKFDIRDNAKYLKAFYLEALAKRNDLMSPEK